MNFYIIVNPVVDLSIRNLCRHPYHLHKNGCPNYGKRSDCPPFAPTIDELIQLDKPVFAIYNKFDLRDHVERMREKHPDWTVHQLRCVLYWQSTARKQLKENIKKFKKLYPDLFIVKNPEASGVNVSETMKGVGIILDWPPEEYAYQIVLAGTKC